MIRAAPRYASHVFNSGLEGCIRAKPNPNVHAFIVRVPKISRVTRGSHLIPLATKVSSMKRSTPVPADCYLEYLSDGRAMLRSGTERGLRAIQEIYWGYLTNNVRFLWPFEVRLALSNLDRLGLRVMTLR